MRPIESGLKELAGAIRAKSHRDKDIAIGNAALALYQDPNRSDNLADCLTTVREAFNETRTANTKPS